MPSTATSMGANPSLRYVMEKPDAGLLMKPTFVPIDAVPDVAPGCCAWRNKSLAHNSNFHVKVAHI